MSQEKIGLEELCRVAVEAAQTAGEIALSGFRGDLQIRSKGHKDIVTQYDTQAEDAAIKVIKKRFPDHSFLAEESGTGEAGDAAQPQYLWVIDPIDGTHNYAMQLPFWCCAVGVVDTRAGAVVAAAVYDPVHEELFTATVGGGAYLNGERMAVGAADQLEDASFGFDIGHDAAIADRMLDMTKRMFSAAKRVRLLGSAVLAMTYVAAGRLDGFYHLDLQPWDIAAASLLIIEAGGVISSWDGEPVGWQRSSAAVSNPLLHPDLLTLLQS